MRFGLREEIYEKIVNIARQFEYKFMIFGSRARGDYKKNSDIDIAIIGENIKDKEYKIRSEFDKIDMEYTVDLVFVNQDTKKELVQNIEKESIEII